MAIQLGLLGHRAAAALWHAPVQLAHGCLSHVTALMLDKNPLGHPLLQVETNTKLVLLYCPYLQDELQMFLFFWMYLCASDHGNSLSLAGRVFS